MEQKISRHLSSLLLVGVLFCGCQKAPPKSTPGNAAPALPTPTMTTPGVAPPGTPRTVKTPPAAVGRRKLGPDMLEGFRVGMTRQQVRALPRFRPETPAECAAWCQERGECCSPKMVAGYYSLRGPDPKAVYLRGMVATHPVRITANFHDQRGLFRLKAIFTAYRKDKPIMSTPMGAYCRKAFGAPVKTSRAGKRARFKTPWGLALLRKHEESSSCHCPKGNKCKCGVKRWTEYLLVVKAIRP